MAAGGGFEKWDFGIEFMDTFSLLDLCLQSSVLQEGFLPELSKSSAAFGLLALRGSISDGAIVSPRQVVFETESDERTLRFADSTGMEPSPLVERGYDICFPMTTVPLGKLRRECAKWRHDRRIRAPLPPSCCHTVRVGQWGTIRESIKKKIWRAAHLLPASLLRTLVQTIQ